MDADPDNIHWADYPWLGFNKDWVVVTVNLFPNSGGSLQGALVCAFNKSDL